MAPRRILILSIAAALAVVLGFGPAASAGGGWWNETNPNAVDSEVNVTGEPHKGANAQGDVTGFIDAHTHMFSNEGFGGRAVCGKPFSEDGIEAALKDCDRHEVSLMENLTNGAAERGLLDAHDTIGWPTFVDWPTYSSFTHQQMYYKWIERAWRGGQRILVNDMVSNTGMCKILGLIDGPNTAPCDDMDAVRRQIKATRDLESYVDRKYGGAGKGWFRVVTNPEQAEKVVKEGKLAVVLGVEVSEPFGCKQTLGVAGCSRADIDRGLDEMKTAGVSSMFLCHKFDNALCGVRYDSDTTGIIVNAGQFLTTGTWWNPKPCKEGEVPDNEVIGGVMPKELAAKGLPALLPVYPKGPHCNPLGLSKLGEYALRGMMDRNMIVELDHMSAKAAGRTLDIMESEGYPGGVSSHSWMAEEYMDRMFALGGFAAQYGYGAEAFVDGWQKTREMRDKYQVSLGFGADMNGFGGTPPPPGKNAKISYPFTSADGGSVLEKQKTGERTWDYNTEGVSHYGMLPDWIESMRQLGGDAIIDDLEGSAQSYLSTWQATKSFEKGTNLAQEGRASASSREWSMFTSYKAHRANDGKTSTRWASDWRNDAEWWQVDLGTSRQVSKVTIEWEKAYGKSYKIQVSQDGSSWTTAGEVTNGKGGLDTVKLDDTSARFVRMQGVSRGTKYGYSIKEFGVFS